MAGPNGQRPRDQPKRRAGAAHDEPCPFEITVHGQPEPELAVEAVLTLLGLGAPSVRATERLRPNKNRRRRPGPQAS